MTTIVEKLPHKNFEYIGMRLIMGDPFRIYEEAYDSSKAEYTDQCPDCGCRLELTDSLMQTWYCPDCDENWDRELLEIERELEEYAVPCPQEEYEAEKGQQWQEQLLKARYGGVPEHIQDFWDGVRKIGTYAR